MQSTETLQPGMLAPDFTAKNTKGDTVSLHDYRGKKVVLYFYPKDDTPGCTVEACGLRDQYEPIRKYGTEILGVSVDDSVSHQKFTDKFQLPFQLVADTDKRITKEYGVYNEQWGMAKRWTFIIDEDGRIMKIFQNVKPQNHPQEIIDFLKQSTTIPSQ
jgi:peroxiredoxin Q/BCP